MATQSDERLQKEVLQTVTRISQTITKLDKEYLGLRKEYRKTEEYLTNVTNDFKEAKDKYDKVNSAITKQEKQRKVVPISKKKAEIVLRNKLKAKADRLQRQENEARTEYLRAKGQILKRGESIKEDLIRLKKPLLSFKVTALGGPKQKLTLSVINELEAHISSDLAKIRGGA